jgi:hypothetical protein
LIKLGNDLTGRRVLALPNYYATKTADCPPEKF